jgi:hypothetical protein
MCILHLYPPWPLGTPWPWIGSSVASTSSRGARGPLRRRPSSGARTVRAGPFARGAVPAGATDEEGHRSHEASTAPSC